MMELSFQLYITQQVRTRTKKGDEIVCHASSHLQIKSTVVIRLNAMGSKMVLLTEAVTACCWIMNCTQAPQSLGVTRSLSNYFLRNNTIDLNIPIMSHSNYHCMKKSDIFFTVWRSIMLLFHTQPPQNQYFSTPHLNKSLIASSTQFTMIMRFTIDSWFICKAH